MRRPSCAETSLRGPVSGPLGWIGRAQAYSVALLTDAPVEERQQLDADEAALVARLRAGDERAFDDVVTRFYPSMLSVARGYVRSRSAKATSVSCSTAHGHGFAPRAKATSMREPTREFEHGYTCNQVVELATDYVEHALPPQLVEPFEMHLNLCDGCFTFIEQIRTTAELGGRLTEEQIPEETNAQLLAAFREWQQR